MILSARYGAVASSLPAGGGDAYTLIDTVTVLSNVSSITFSSIPDTYDDLQILFRNYQVTSSGYLTLRMNGISSSTYDYATIYANNGFTGQVLHYNYTQLGITVDSVPYSGAFGGGQIDILSYRTTDFDKQIISFVGHTQASYRKLYYCIGATPTTSAISSITLLHNGSSALMGAGSKFSLYGITKAS